MKVRTSFTCSTTNWFGLLTAVENGGAGAVSRRSKMAAHNRAVLCEGVIGVAAPIAPLAE